MTNHAEYDASQVDWLAVEFVLNGTRMKVNRDTRAAVVHRMGDRWTAEEAAERMGTYPTEIERIRAAIKRDAA